ncbi:hypothetical protein Scep_012789 [Stephania cephalantha]|uniref:NmrA-like domain-containing protein n=1 Tax=Stephania cephalantha TaxID=152367 RepID=A0AAP0JH18_9MAGN
MDINKIQLLLRLKKRGAKFIEGSLSDHESLVHAVKQVDVVISALSSSDTSTVATQLQHKIIDAIKETGNVKRFIPAEFCIDPARMVHDLEPARSLNLGMMDVRKAIVNAKIPYTSVAANCFAGYFVPNLCQLGTFLPPKDKISIFGDGNAKGYLKSFELKEGDEEAMRLYPDVKYTTVEEYLKRFAYMRPRETWEVRREVSKL